jgi:predicted metalloprotease with PDZ domain
MPHISTHSIRCLTLALLCVAVLVPPQLWADTSTYEARYRAEVHPDRGTIHVELKLAGERLPRKLVFSIDPRRHTAFAATDTLEVTGNTVTWTPHGKVSRLNYDFVVNHERSRGSFDSLLTPDFALFRADRMIPRVSVTARRGLQSHATLKFVLPQGWTAATAYATSDSGEFQIDDPARRFDRPEGWMLLGKLGKRSEIIAGVQTIVAAPDNNNARRQDMLAFLNWNLPYLVEVFPDFPKRVLIAMAGDPMWRGGLSGPGSMFIHADRPLISENRTSTVLHELTHIALGIHGDEESDWIVEGLAEYYSLETVHRSGGIGKQRYEEALARLDKWAARAPNLFRTNSSGATTARAVMVFKSVDAEIRKLTSGKATLDDIARELASHGGEVGLERLQAAARKVAGQPLQSLDRHALSNRRKE